MTNQQKNGNTYVNCNVTEVHKHYYGQPVKDVKPTLKLESITKWFHSIVRILTSFFTVYLFLGTHTVVY